MKKLMIGLFVILFITNYFNKKIISASDIEWKNIQNKEITIEDQGKTFVDLSKDSNYVLDGKIVVVGDSFAYLFASHCGSKINHVVHQGYNVERINDELMDLIPNYQFKYCFLFIGPNDYMEQTDIFKFQMQLQLIFNKAHDRNMEVIVTNYYDPDYNDEKAQVLSFCTIPCYVYELILKDLAERNGYNFMDINDLLAQYGHHKGDFIHPNRAINKPILARLLALIKSDSFYR